MDESRWERIQDLFHDVLSLGQSEQRSQLEAKCGADQELLDEVLAMLQADREAGSMLDRGLPSLAGHLVGGSINFAASGGFGPYRLKEMLGEGGMGVVWLAEREDAGNLVAIKFLPHAGLSPARRERFAREIKTLGKLKHPFIARLYDAGVLGDGTPWFVMEYVEGTHLGEYCRRERPDVEQRLELFRRICEAVQYAHGQEIIHRDLKPSNILVEPDGTPRLLDFGIARELQNDGEQIDRTRPGLRFLSPHYAAPEWVRDGTVGLYTDVFSLGVILYEMLSGRLPGRTGAGGPSQDQPERPSAEGKRLWPLTNSAWSDLDVMCLKAIHDEPEKRYQSVAALISDVDHFLNCEPLDARPDSFRYRLSRFTARNRRSVIGASLTLALVVLLVVFFMIRLSRERNMALAEAERTRRIQNFMLDLFGAGDKHASPSSELRVVTLLDRGAQQARTLDADPETQSELYQSLGRMYDMLGKHQKAGELLRLAVAKARAAFGAESPQVAEALIQLGLSSNSEARFDEAQRIIREGLAIAARHLAPDHPTVLRARSSLGLVLADGGSYEKAIAVLQPVLKLQRFEDSTYTLTALAAAEDHAGRRDLAESFDRQALNLDRRLHGNSHPRVAFDLSELATLEANLGRFSEAEKLYREALGIDQAWYGEDHPDTILCANLLALILIHEGNYDGAAPLLKKVLAIQEQTYGEIHPYVALALDTLGTLDLKRGDLAGAEQMHRRAIAILDKVFGGDNHQTAMAKAHLAQVFIAKKNDREAEPLLRDALRVQIEKSSKGNMSVGGIQALLGGVLVREKRYQEAETYLMSAYGILITQPKTYASRLQETRTDLAAVYDALREPEKAAAFRAELSPGQGK